MSYIIIHSLLLLLLTLFLITTTSVHGLLYDHSASANGNLVVLQWTIGSDAAPPQEQGNNKFHFSVTVSDVDGGEPPRWLCIGVTSQISSMPGADIGCVTESDPTVMSDMYATGYTSPLPDDCSVSDWALSGFSRNATHTTAQGWRLVGNARDPQHDNAIAVGAGELQKFIFAWGVQSTGMTYHGNDDMATLNVNLATGAAGPPAALHEGKQSFFIGQVAGFNITNPSTDYVRSPCQTLPSPSGGGHVYATGFKSSLDAQATCTTCKNYVHHLVVKGFRKSATCGDKDMPIDFFVAASDPNSWFMLPVDGDGQQLSLNLSSFASVTVELHYEPGGRTGIIDHSGVDVYYSSSAPGPNIAALIQFGDPGVILRSTYKTLPQGLSKYSFSCPSSCTQYWPHPIKIFATLLHTHHHGVFLQDSYRHGQNGSEYAQFRANFYDFHRQKLALLPEPVVVRPGDEVVNTYGYMTHGATTEFGLGTMQEMALSMSMYYPAFPASFVSAAVAPAVYCGYKLCGNMLQNESVASAAAFDRSWGNPVCPSSSTTAAAGATSSAAPGSTTGAAETTAATTAAAPPATTSSAAAVYGSTTTQQQQQQQTTSSSGGGGATTAQQQTTSANSNVSTAAPSQATTSTSSSTVAPANDNASPAGNNTAPVANRQLGTAQIVGIAVGCTAGLAIAVFAGWSTYSKISKMPKLDSYIEDTVSYQQFSALNAQGMEVGMAREMHEPMQL